MTKLYVVLPCYNEEEVLPETTKRLSTKMNELIARQIIREDSKIVYVDDGSKDKTWSLIERQNQENPLVQGVKLTRNKGHQNALLAGLMTVRDCCDATISMDADLQDDVQVIETMVAEYEKGNEIVYGVRSSRDTDTVFKKSTALGFYKLMKFLGADTVFNHADCRLMSGLALNRLAEFKEVNLFLRGIVPMIGYKSSIAYYDRSERFAGESKYPLKKMIAFAWQGVTSLSAKPIKMITITGILLSLLGFIALIVFLILYSSSAVGMLWPILCAISLACGLQLTAIGVIGEYVGKSYIEIKGRPRFFVETYLE
ncbi:MAG: glycosyltransferase family 2 protein [Oscillospiraceae bacterium]|jgi:glycosyltransferase involved in cell wall biosynthesis|nr:glycosyltransferase family 2 protein [Oscillospiraceae bacterium]